MAEILHDLICQNPRRHGGITESSKYPMVKDSGPKYHEGHGFWDQQPSILSTWTLFLPYAR